MAVFVPNGEDKDTSLPDHNNGVVISTTDFISDCTVRAVHELATAN